MKSTVSNVKEQVSTREVMFARNAKELENSMPNSSVMISSKSISKKSSHFLRMKSKNNWMKNLRISSSKVKLRSLNRVFWFKRMKDLKWSSKSSLLSTMPFLMVGILIVRQLLVNHSLKK